MPKNNLPVIDAAYTEAIFQALATMDVTLDTDPLAHGPKRMNGKIATCRNFLDRCQQLFIQVSNHQHILKRAGRVAQLEFNMKLQDMLANDPETRAGRSLRDREAIATMKLRDEREQMSDIESSTEDLDTVMSVIKAKRDDLKDILNRIRDQLKLCQEELNLGGRWGGVRYTATPHRTYQTGAVDPAALALLDEIPGDGDASISDIERIVQASLAQQHAAEESQSDTPALAPVTESDTPPIDDIDLYLKNLNSDSANQTPNDRPNPPVFGEIDLDDLLGS